MSKKTVVVDIDGVILNFSKSFSAWWNQKFPDEKSIPDNPHDWQFDHPNLLLVLERIDEYIQTQEPYELMEERIPEYLSKLQEKYYVHLVTAFPEEYRDFRLANLAMHQIPYDEITFADGHKIDLVRTLHPVALVEDSPKNVMDFAEHGYPVYVPRYWNYTKNLDHKLITFYDSWEELIEMIDH